MTMAAELDAFRGFVTEALGPLVRVTKDSEGWLMVPGRFGRLEWRGAEGKTGEARLYAFTGRRRMIPKLQALSGVHPQQIVDTEAACWLRADAGSAIRAVWPPFCSSGGAGRPWTLTRPGR